MKAWMIKKPDGTLLDFTCSYNEDQSWTELVKQYSSSLGDELGWKRRFFQQGYRCVRVTIKEEK